MAIFCILIGILMLLGFTGAGYFAASTLMKQQTIVSLFNLDPSMVWIITGICAVIGLLFCLNWVVLGVNCAQIRKLKRRRKKREA